MTKALWAKRLLFVTPPNLSLALSLVPLAKAALTTGHHVRFATAASTTRLLRDADLPAIDVAPNLELAAITRHAEAAFVSNRPATHADQPSEPHFFQLYADAMVDGTVRLARQWRPDVIVHPPQAVVVRTVAGELGLPTVFHGVGFLHHPDMLVPWRRAASPRAADANPNQIAAIDIAPPSMSAVGEYGWHLRPIPHDVDAQLPGQLANQPALPRVAVTLGTVAPGIVGLEALSWLLTGAARCDAEFVVALGGVDPDVLGALPGNVRAVSWVPLPALLRTCTAIVHHGGAGSALASLDAGLPQLVLPQGADQFDNGAVLTGRGVGFRPEPGESAEAALTRLLTDSRLAVSAREVSAELRALPHPAQVVAQLVGLL